MTIDIPVQYTGSSFFQLPMGVTGLEIGRQIQSHLLSGDDVWEKSVSYKFASAREVLVATATMLVTICDRIGRCVEPWVDTHLLVQIPSYPYIFSLVFRYVHKCTRQENSFHMVKWYSRKVSRISGFFYTSFQPRKSSIKSSLWTSLCFFDSTSCTNIHPRLAETKIFAGFCFLAFQFQFHTNNRRYVRMQKPVFEKF